VARAYLPGATDASTLEIIIMISSMAWAGWSGLMVAYLKASGPMESKMERVDTPMLTAGLWSDNGKMVSF
jgi:hypothetical protein